MPKFSLMKSGKSDFHEQAGFFNLPNDNIVKTLGMALLICLVCSIVVSTAATVLKPKQVANKLQDKKSNILSVAGIVDPSKSVDELFKQVETRVVDMESGEYTDAVDAETYDQLKASKDPAYRVTLSNAEDLASIGARAKYASVYLVRNGEQLEKIVIPVKGYGLWSTMYGFLALESDATTVAGITFYDHGETPGLGGEIENKKWQASWQGKQIVNSQGEAVLGLVKGMVSSGSAEAQYQVDGLSGATLTSTGVTNLIQFWVGENGFGPYLQRQRSGAAVEQPAAAMINTEPQIPSSGTRG